MDYKEDKKLSTIAGKVKILKDPSQTALRFYLNTRNCGEDRSYCTQPLVGVGLARQHFLVSVN